MPNFTLKVASTRHLGEIVTKMVGGGMIFIRDGLIAKRLYSYEDNTCETMLGSHNF